MTDKLSRILIVRNDRMGDLVLTTPMFEAIKRANPKAMVSALIAPGNFELLRENPYVDDILLDDYDRSLRGARDLAYDLRRREFDAAMIAIPSFGVCLATFLAQIPVRICPGTHLYPFLFCNRTPSQHRSRAQKNEAEYNLELLDELELGGFDNVRPCLQTYSEDREWAKQKLSILGINNQDRKLAIVHPGMGGSALNWSARSWHELVRMIAGDQRLRCLLTGVNSDRKMIQEVLWGLDELDIETLAGQTTVGQLMALLEQAFVFVGPSTGPMHVAAALGTNTLAIFSPVRVHNSKRWGPWHAPHAQVFAPSVPCSGHFRCLQSKCEYYGCMDRIEPVRVFDGILKILD